MNIDASDRNLFLGLSNMNVFTERLKTFENYTNLDHPSWSFADAGFYMEDDWIKCAFCKIVFPHFLVNTETCSNMLECHFKLERQCKYLRMKLLHLDTYISINDVYLEMSQVEKESSLLPSAANFYSLLPLKEVAGEGASMFSSSAALLDFGKICKKIEAYKEKTDCYKCLSCKIRGISTLLSPCKHAIYCKLCCDSKAICEFCDQPIEGVLRIQGVPKWI